MITYSKKEIEAAFEHMLATVLKDIERDQTKVLTTATGSNFTILLVPSKDPKFVDMVIAEMNK